MRPRHLFSSASLWRLAAFTTLASAGVVALSCGTSDDGSPGKVDFGQPSGSGASSVADASLSTSSGGGRAVLVTGDGGSLGGGSTGPSCDTSKGPYDSPCSFTEAYGVFAAPTGSDSAGDGSRAHPFATVTKAAATATVSGKHVYLCANAGAYDELATIAPTAPTSLAIYGGALCTGGTWTYSSAYHAQITPSAQGSALHTTNLTALTLVDVDAWAQPGVQPGESSIAVILAGVAPSASTATLLRVALHAGNGVNGADGVANASRGADGAPGRPGANGCEVGAAAGPGTGGLGGLSMCGGSSSAGGSGGSGGGAMNGLVDEGGSMGSNGTPGGPPVVCSGFEPFCFGNPGFSATTVGAGGSPGAGAGGIGLIDSAGWHGIPGDTGGSGSPGGGGGGGSGGNVPPTFAVCGAPGQRASGGGGGGGGGCPGLGGAGGQAGGSSIALLALDTAVTVQDATLASGTGGNGGRGAAGQTGGAGGLGAAGGSSGGAGGNGSTAGPGGPGGGGGGGHSLGIAYSAVAPTWTNTTITNQKGGVGGPDSLGNTTKTRSSPGVGLSGRASAKLTGWGIDDSTPPVGTELLGVNVVNVDCAVTLTFTAATDDTTLPGDIQYQICADTTEGGCSNYRMFTGSQLTPVTPDGGAPDGGTVYAASFTKLDGGTYSFSVQVSDTAQNAITTNAIVATVPTLSPQKPTVVNTLTVTLDPSNPESLRASWDPGTDDCTTGGAFTYVVTATATSGPGTGTSSTTGSTSLVLLGLKPSTSYDVSVYAKDEAGFSGDPVDLSRSTAVSFTSNVEGYLSTCAQSQCHSHPELAASCDGIVNNSYPYPCSNCSAGRLVDSANHNPGASSLYEFPFGCDTSMGADPAAGPVLQAWIDQGAVCGH